MKVLHVISNLGVGGAESMLAKLLRETHERVESRVVSLTCDGPMGERIRALGVETAFLGMRRGTPDPRGILALAREMRRFRPDLVQTWMYHADLVGGLAALLVGRPPVIWGIRNAEVDDSTAKWTTRQTLRTCAWLSRWLPARIVSCSERAREFHVAHGYDPAKIVVIPNGFDLQAFDSSPAVRESVRTELSIPLDAPLVGMVARYHPMKDFRNFSLAAGLARRSSPGLWFLLCGDGVTADNAELMRWLREAGVADRTLLLGQRHDVARILAALDVFTLSSASEGFPNVLGEAMACGVPCVATDAGDAGSVMREAGRLVPTRDPEALAGAWCEVLDISPTGRREIGRAGRERVISQFDIRAVARRFMELYWDSCGQRRAGQ